MAESIKTGLLKAIESRLAEIPELKTVRRWEDIPTDLSALTRPVAFFYEEEEDESRNRLTVGNLDFWVQAFFDLDQDDPASYTAFSEEAEQVAGKIKNMFANPGSLRAHGLIQAKPPTRVIKAKYNSDYGVLFMSYELTYGHARGDAFSLNS